MPLTEVQSEQLRILQAHGLLTIPRMAHILEHDAAALQWAADNWHVSSSPQANAEVRQVAREARSLVINSHQLDPGL